MARPLRAVGQAIAVTGWMACALAIGGCDKPAPPPVTAAADAAERNFFAKPPKVDYSQVKVEAPPQAAVEPAKPTADTWASRTRALVAEAHEDILKCRNEFLIPFQFEKMRTRNVEWLAVGEMDAVCRDGDRATKRRGPWSILTFLAREHLGRHPALDRFLAWGHDHVEHARLVGLMAKKVGSPKIAAVTDVAKSARDHAIASGRLVDEAAREIAAWPDDLLPADDNAAASKPMDAQTLSAAMRDHYGLVLGDAVAAYDRLASESWQAPNMVKKTTLRLWGDIPERWLQLDRPRLAQAAGLSEAERKRFTSYLEKVQAVVDAWKKSYERYFDDKEGDTWAPKDPWRPSLVKAQAAWAKAHEALGK